MAELLVHLGLPKAASTWLQDVFFHGHPELAVLGSARGDGTLHAPFVKAVRALVLAADLTIDPARFRAEVDTLLDALVAVRRGAGHTARLRGISHEVLAGEWPHARNALTVARAVRDAYPDGRVLIALREQRSFLESTWREYVRLGSALPFRRFLFDPVVSGGAIHDDEPLRTHVLESACFSRRVDALFELFGRERVLVVCMEELARDPAAFCGRLCAFLGVAPFEPERERSNPQLSPAALWLLRPLNRLFHTPYHPRTGPLPLHALLAWRMARRRPRDAADANRAALLLRAGGRLQRELAQRLLPVLDRALLRRLPRSRRGPFADLPPALRTFAEDRFARDNARLCALTGLDLRALGYRMPDA